MNLQRFSVAICLFVFATTLFAQVTDDCARLQAEKGYPSYYCDCKEDYTDFVLPVDTIVYQDSIWFKGWVSDLYDGLSAYLHSDCDLNFEVYTSCTAKTPKYSALFAQNQANAIDGEAIKRKLQENNVGDMDVAFYICISPVAGNGGRLIMRKQNEGMPSTCDDPLYIFPGMSLYSTRPNDVYVVDPNQLYDITDIILEWEPNTQIPCQLQITQATCDGPTIAQATLNPDDIYILPAEQVKQAKDNNQQLFFHVSHAANTAGMFHCLAPEYDEYYIDTLLCQGMELQVHDTLLTEATVYTIDTIHEFANVYTIYFYDLSFYEPDLQYDTLAFRYTHQPYLYRNQHTISKPGNYDLTIHTPGACDERYMLHVYHDIDTLVNIVDTSLCYGASFEHEGKLYQKNISFAKAEWKNQDTLLLDTLNVYFATTPEIVYDTIMQGERIYGKTFNQPGDYRFTYTNPTTFCVDSIILKVKPGTDANIQYNYVYIDTTLCQGVVYDHWGIECTVDTVIYDTIPLVANKLYDVEITTVTFTQPDIQHNTISLKSTQLPYIYNKYCTVDTFGIYDYTVHVNGKCDERYQLLVLHDIDTTYQTIDTTLCQGMVYLHNGVEYTTATTFVDSTWVNDDTFALTTVSVTFLAPETQNDTLSLRSTDLPYTYRNQHTITTYGDYDLTIHVDGECDERYLLHVSHAIDTLTQSLDTTLCQGMVYLHNGVEYTTATTFVDSAWVNVDTFALTTVSVTFLAPETQNDTLSLRSTDLPYTYRNQHTITTYGDYDLTIHVDGECDERYQLSVLHDIDTTYQTIDTTLCQGKTYLYNGVEYSSDITLVDTLQLDADTYQILTIHVAFTAPDIQPDTISLKTTQLPYTYREQYTVDNFGGHDVLIHTPGSCDERYQLLVLHDIDTLTQSLDTTLCQGKTYLYNGVEYSSDMTLVDTLQLDADTYQILTIHVAFTAPDIQSDTLSLKTTDLPYTYREQYIVEDFGEYDVLIYTPGACDERYQLQVLHDIDTLTQSLDTTLCQGMAYLYNGVEYSSDMTLVDTLQLDADTYQILTIQVSFLAPDIHPDTISLKTTDLPYTYREQYIAEDFGEHDVLIHTPGACDEHYQLLVLHDIDTLTQSLDTTLCQGKTYLYNGVEYSSDMTLVDTLQLDADTYQILTIHVAFTAPDIQPDTISLKTTDLPYTYREQYIVEDFGEYDVLIYTPGSCDERYQLQVLHDIDTLVLEADTFLCYGKTFVYEAQEYQADTLLQTISWLNADTIQIDILTVSFSTQPIELFDTLLLASTELPYEYRDTLIEAFGEYELLIYNNEGCLELIYLSVQEKTPTSLDDTPIYDRPRLILRDGVVYVLRGSEMFTVLGQPVSATQP